MIGGWAVRRAASRHRDAFILQLHGGYGNTPVMAYIFTAKGRPSIHRVLREERGQEGAGVLFFGVENVILFAEVGDRRSVDARNVGIDRPISRNPPMVA